MYRSPAQERRRVTIETFGESLTLGHHAFRPADPVDVLTVDGAAALLGTDPGTVVALAESGEVPARRLGGEWRFARRALLDWLARGEGG
jgi:excisionase family DNA binding protein